MAGILVFAENNELLLNLANKGAELAGKLGVPLDVAVLGSGAAQRASALDATGAGKVFVSEDPALAGLESAVCARALAQIVQLSGADMVLLAATKRGRQIAPRLGLLLDAACQSGVLDVQVQENKLLTSRFGLGGTTIITEVIETPRQIIGVLPQTFEAARTGQAKPSMVNVDLKLEQPKVAVTKSEVRPHEAVDVGKAGVLVCVGRGVRKKEDLEMVRQLAALVRGEICCTRDPASNLGWLTEDRIVGVSGKRVKPKLLISLGVSGQSQHIAGIVGARTIVAVNIDANAPIFAVADYGIVEDLYKVVPRLNELLRQQK